MITQIVEVLKITSNLIASAGVTTVVGHIVKSTTPADIGKVNKALTVIGGLMISTVLAREATDYLENEIDKIASPLILSQLPDELIAEESTTDAS